jgi:hypothetical protein
MEEERKLAEKAKVENKALFESEKKSNLKNKNKKFIFG